MNYTLTKEMQEYRFKLNTVYIRKIFDIYIAMFTTKTEQKTDPLKPTKLTLLGLVLGFLVTLEAVKAALKTALSKTFMNRPPKPPPPSQIQQPHYKAFQKGL